MAELFSLEMDRIKINPDLQLRIHIDPDRVKEYAELMEAGKTRFPPLEVGRFCAYSEPSDLMGDNFYLIDGFHRYEAMKLVAAKLGGTQGKKIDVHCDYYSGFSAMFEKALRMNQHGLPLTRDERNAAVATIILKRKGETLQQLATRCGVSKSTIARIRDELSQMGKLNLDGTTTGADGKQRKQKYAKREEEPEKEPEMVECPKCGKKELSTNLERAGWVSKKEEGHNGKMVWYCSEDCLDWMNDLTNEENWEHQHHEPELGCGGESVVEITAEPDPEPEESPEAVHPKMVRCAVCGREAPLDAAMFHASSWIYDADSFDSEKMTWTRWFCTPGCESRWNVEQSGNAAWETNKEIHAKEIVEVLYGLYERTGYVNEDPLRAKEVHDLAWELYLKKVNGKENDE